jgi:hypothetical protein
MLWHIDVPRASRNSEISFECSDGTIIIYNSRYSLHCESGPAIIYPNGRVEHYLEGRRVKSENFQKELLVWQLTQIIEK